MNLREITKDQAAQMRKAGLGSEVIIKTEKRYYIRSNKASASSKPRRKRMLAKYTRVYPVARGSQPDIPEKAWFKQAVWDAVHKVFTADVKAKKMGLMKDKLNSLIARELKLSGPNDTDMVNGYLNSFADEGFLRQEYTRK